MKSDSANFEMADIYTPLLHNQWYAAGFVSEFAQGLHERVLLERSVVLFRTQDGELVALQNRCAHRSYPLSNGVIEGNEIRCLYHGAKYNAKGELTEMPSVRSCPKVSIRRYPVRVSGPVVWIWMGESGAGDEALLPKTPWLESADWGHVTGFCAVECNWLLLAENLMDLTHLAFLHNSTLNIPRSYAEILPKIEKSGDTITYYRANPSNHHRSPFFRPALSDQLEKAGYDSKSMVTFASPALSYGGGSFFVKDTDLTEQPEYIFSLSHFLTPETQNRTSYRYIFSRNYALPDQDLSAIIGDVVQRAFVEDRVALASIQRMFETDKAPFRETIFQSDGPGVAMRRVVASLARRERAAAMDLQK
jgi:vanillate O-demethylase monooxygenase subunit